MRRGLLTVIVLFQFSFALHLPAQIRFEVVKPEIVQARLARYRGNDLQREATLFKSFVEAGCPAANLSEQPVPKRKQPNVICVLPGDTAEEVVVGAHFDHVPAGSGVVDNWSGASLLPSLFQSLLGSRHKHTFAFIGFTGEEDGEIGSDFYVKSLSTAELSRIKLMVTIDTIGLGPTEVWVSRSDRKAVGLLNATAQLMKLPLIGVNVDGFGESDEEPFIKRGVRTITVHTVTNENKRVLHSELDRLAAINLQDYYNTYRLLAGFLAELDLRESTESPAHPRDTERISFKLASAVLAIACSWVSMPALPSSSMADSQLRTERSRRHTGIQMQKGKGPRRITLSGPVCSG